MNALNRLRNVVANLLVFVLIVSTFSGLLALLFTGGIGAEPFYYTLRHITPTAFLLLLLLGFGCLAVELRDLSDYIAVTLFVLGATILVTLSTPGNMFLVSKICGCLLGPDS